MTNALRLMTLCFALCGGAPLAADGSSSDFLGIDAPLDADLPVDLTYTEDGRHVLVVNQRSETLTMTVADTGRCVATIEVGHQPTDVERVPGGKLALVTNTMSGSLSLVDLSTGSVAGEIPLSIPLPRLARVDGSGRLAVVAGRETQSSWRVSVVSLASRTELYTFDTDVASLPHFFSRLDYRSSFETYDGVQLTPDGTTLVLYDHYARAIRLYDVATGQLRATTLFAKPTQYGRRITLNAAGTRALVPYDDHDFPAVRGLLYFDPHSGQVIADWQLAQVREDCAARFCSDDQTAVLSTGGETAFVDLATGVVELVDAGAYALEVTGDGTHVASFRQGLEPGLSVIDISTRTVAAELPVPTTNHLVASPTGVGIAALEFLLGDHLVIAEADGANTRFDTYRTGESIARDGPVDVALVRGGHVALVVNALSDNVTVVDLTGREVLHDIPLADNPFAVDTSADGTIGAVIHYREPCLSLIAPHEGRELARVPLPGRGRAVCVDPAGLEAYVLIQDAWRGVVRVAIDGENSHVLTQAWDDITSEEELLLAPDGLGLVYHCRSTGTLNILDRTSFAVLASLPVDPLPKRFFFSADGSELYLFGGVSAKVQVYAYDGANTVLDREGPEPLYVSAGVLGEQEEYAYFCAATGTGWSISALRTDTLEVIASVPLASRSDRLVLSGSSLYTSFYFANELDHFRAAGLQTQLLERIRIDGWPTDLIISEALDAVVTLQAEKRDGLDLTRLGRQ